MRIDAIMRTGKIQEVEPRNTVSDDFEKKMAEKRSATDIESKLKSLLERIDIQGSKISKTFSLDALKEYKKLVIEFLNLTVSNAYKFTKQNHLDNRGRHRIYTIVKKVNEEMDQLTKDLLATEKNTISVLGKIENIRGMLLDVMA